MIGSLGSARAVLARSPHGIGSHLGMASVALTRAISSIPKAMSQPKPGTHIDEIKEAARKTGDAAKEWTSGTTTPASQEVSPALREVKSARETLETSVSALKETETPVKQRGNGLTGKSGPAPLHHHQHQRQNAKSAAPVADSTRESLGKEINNASQVIGANPGATAPEKDCAPTPI